MNWSKVKSIMIAFLILANLSLLSYIIYEEVSVNKRNEQMAQTITSLLATKNIKVDEKLVFENAKKTSAQSIYVDNIISDYKTFSHNVLGDNVIEKNPFEYKTDTASIAFRGDYFEVRAQKNNVLYAERINKVNAHRISEKYLKQLGFDTKNSEKNTEYENNTFKVSFSKKINDLRAFKIGVAVEMNESGITSIYGSWYNESPQNSTISELKSISGVLVEYMNKKSDASEISDIQLGYSMPSDNTFHESIYLTPVWKITDANKNALYIDARENN